MRKLITATVFVCSVAAFPALASAEDEADNATAENDPYAPDAIRCERVPITGSRVRRTRVCMTNAEWADQRAAGNRNATELLDNASRDHTQRN